MNTHTLDADPSNPPPTTTTKLSWKQRLLRLFKRDPEDRSELVSVLREAETNNVLKPDALTMIEGVLTVSDMEVRDIMIPRTQMVVVQETMSPAEFLPAIIESRHSRFPVFNQNHDEVIGILLAKDLLGVNLDDSNFDIHDLLRPVTVTPESKRLNILLHEFRAKQNHMAMVVDEYGQIAGLVTIEDVLEQIVGEIEDEYDHEEDDYIKALNDECYTVKAHTPVEEFNQYFNAHFKNDDCDTIGGLVLQSLGHLPERNEKTEIAGFHFKILNADKRRIRLLEVTHAA